MSSIVSTATPSRPTSPRLSGASESWPISVGMSNAVESPVWPLLEQIAEALIRLDRGPEPGELAHRPQPPAIHRRVDAARERIRAGQPDLRRRRKIGRRVQRPDLLTRQRRERALTLRRGGIGGRPSVVPVGARRHRETVTDGRHSGYFYGGFAPGPVRFAAPAARPARRGRRALSLARSASPRPGRRRCARRRAARRGEIAEDAVLGVAAAGRADRPGDHRLAGVSHLSSPAAGRGASRSRPAGSRWCLHRSA